MNYFILSLYLNKTRMKLPPSQTVQLKLHEHFTLTLKGRSAAGYQWTPATDKENIISINKKIAAQNKDPQKLIGASSDEVFTITALQKGKVTVHFKQLRVWEAGSKPVEEKILVLVIE